MPVPVLRHSKRQFLPELQSRLDHYYRIDTNLRGNALNRSVDAALYAKQARYCIIFASAQYRDRMWTGHERRAAQARAIESRDSEYILPIRFDDAEIPGLPHTVTYLSSALGTAKIAEMFVRKLGLTA